MINQQINSIVIGEGQYKFLSTYFYIESLSSCHDKHASSIKRSKNLKQNIMNESVNKTTQTWMKRFNS